MRLQSSSWRMWGFLGLLSIGGAAPQTGPASRPAVPHVKLLGSQSVTGIGAGQGVAVRDGLVYLYGDADTGVIREYRLLRKAAPELEWTGREVRLARDGEEVISHPTGLACHAELPTFIGNTVRGKGTIWCVDWKQMWADGNLDHAVRGVVEDDLAVNGCRPEYVPRGKDWLIATADYGGQGNQIRYCDPARLAQAKKTSDPGVLVAREPCGPWVQGLCWLNDDRTLVLIQNQQEGRGWRLTYLPAVVPPASQPAITQDDFDTRGELEGFNAIDRDLCIMLRSSRGDNVWFGTLDRESSGKTATQAAPSSR